MRTTIDLEFFGNTILFGISISNFETKSGNGKWNPAFDINIGFIFFKLTFMRYEL